MVIKSKKAEVGSDLKWELAKDFRFEAAHRLAKGYEGKCKNIHGHSWNGTLTVECWELDKHNFGVDFSELKSFLKRIEDSLDHKLMLCTDDSKLLDLCKAEGYEIVAFEDNPTCEIIAQWIYREAVYYFKSKGIKCIVKSVDIRETCTSGCKYSEI